MENKVITAEEFLGNKLFMRSDLQCETNYQLMIEFAKLHVEAALKQASEYADVEYRGNCFGDYIVDKTSILNAYPLTNIK